MTPGPETPGLPQKHGRFTTHRAALSWAAVLAALVAAVALAVVTLTGDDDTGPVTGDHTGLIEHGSIRAHEGSVEDNAADPEAASGHAGLAEHGSIRANEGSVEDGSSC
jgi:hypothetical protein